MFCCGDRRVSVAMTSISYCVLVAVGPSLSAGEQSCSTPAISAGILHEAIEVAQRRRDK